MRHENYRQRFAEVKTAILTRQQRSLLKIILFVELRAGKDYLQLSSNATHTWLCR